MTLKYIIGTMSGTSLDGLDIACCSFARGKNRWEYTIKEAITIPYTPDLVNLLKGAAGCSGMELIERHHEYGKYIGSEVLHFLELKKCKADLIASHGHTVFHQPGKGIAFQLGNGAAIAAFTGISTVSDFRILDVAHGGQGAPLVPFGDRLLFGEYDACLNLGGFSNISFEKGNRRIAYDICPVNTVINLLSQKAGFAMDKNGAMAAGGMIIPPLLSELNDIEYYRKQFPKSLGLEWLEQQVLPLIAAHRTGIPDLLRTVYEHISLQIAVALNSTGGKNVLVTGGGACNNFLMDLIAKKTRIRLIIPEEKTVHYKEALIFGLLGMLRYLGEINSYSSVTGASRDLSLGVVHLINAQ